MPVSAAASTCLGMAVGLLTCVAGLSAGPLNPPAGAIAATGKTLVEVEPRTAINAVNTPGDADSVYRIAAPGSYYLTENLTGASGKRGIEIAVGGVTIDLKGFEVVGVTGSLEGVRMMSVSLTNVTLRNGTVRGWGGNGVQLGGVSSRVEGVSSSGNTANGISVGNGGVVVHSAAALNGSRGFSFSNGVTAWGCSATDNAGDGFGAASTCVLTGCTAYSNSGHGFTFTALCVLTSCSAGSSGSIGFQGTFGSNTLRSCTAEGSGSHGFSLDMSTAESCESDGNAANGFFIVNGCRVTGCTARSNSAGGLAGFKLAGTDNRLEGNLSRSNSRGFAVDVAGNFLSRNTAAANTVNWETVAGNVCLVVNAVTGPAITGNSGGAAPGSTDPNANFTF